MGLMAEITKILKRLKLPEFCGCVVRFRRNMPTWAGRLSEDDSSMNSINISYIGSVPI